MPSTAAQRPKTHFQKIQNFKPDYAVAEITQYESSRTGMRVAVVDRKSTKVTGEFALATEIHDDSGAPHTLEHLIFMGSRSYKYKGVLDKLANRAYSNTNAWTATDHTAYTLDTAGWAGFAQILPVYLEHVILPTLTDSACYTEVHHIDPTGRDAGVVYSEMQGRQNASDSLMELQANRLVYPEGNGFRYETGGMMEALRVLKAERIRQFHRDMYQPKNLRLCITGQIEHLELLDILEKFEDSIIHDVPSMDEHFTRPWVDSKRTPPLKESIVESVEFPEEDESSGEISVCLFGPDCYDEVESRALDIMLSYMAGSSISFLENTIVEKEQLASAITYYTENRPNILIWFNLSSVDTENLASVEKRIFDVLKDASSKPLDMEYLHDCLHRLKRQIIHGAETTLGIFSDSIIQDHLFGDRKGKNLHDGLASLDGYRVLETWSETQWRDFLVKYFVENPHVSILGVPSTKLSESITADEAARVKKQQDDLGEEGLKKLAKELEEAKAHNDRPIPDAVLESFVTPGPESIPFIHTTTARSGLAKDMGHLENDIQTLIDKDCKDLPLFIHFEHIPAKCVYFSLILSTGAVPLQLKPLLSVYFDNFFTTPIERNGKRMEFENAVKELERDTINYEIDSGGDISNPELIRIKFSVEPEKYAVAIGWLRDLLFSSIFDVERLDSSVSKLFSEIPSLKRDGSDMAGSVDNMVHWAPESSSRAQNTLVKALYLKRIKHLLKSSPQSVIELLETLRKSLLTFSNMRVVVSGDVTGLNGPVSSWQPLVQGLDTKEPLTPLVARKTVLSDAARNPGKLAYIVPMSTSDSSFGYLTGRGVEGFDNPRLPALMVAAAYLDSVEGPLWTAVRGTGLAYGSNFSYSSATGTISFSIYRSPDAFKAYEAARDVVTAYADGSIPFDKFTLQGAVSSIVVQFANEQTTTVKAALVSFINQVVLGVPKDYGSRILKKVREVGPKEIRAVLKDIVLPVFMPGKADLTVTCASIMTEDLEERFKKAGFAVQVQPLAFFQDGYGLKAGAGEDEDGGEDDDEDDDEDEGDSESEEEEKGI